MRILNTLLNHGPNGVRNNGVSLNFYSEIAQKGCALIKYYMIEWNHCKLRNFINVSVMLSKNYTTE